MNIEIRKLTPDLAEDYVHFFDVTPHDDNKDKHKCYCVCWCSDDPEGKNFSSREKRRELALQYVKDGHLQGYLAYCDDEIVGWCNANTKADCLKCSSRQQFIDLVPSEESSIKIKSIFCFVIAPEMKRKGIAAQLLERVCKDATDDGFDFAEAYPKRKSRKVSCDFMGPLAMYEKCGFSKYTEGKGGKGMDRIVMRKALK